MENHLIVQKQRLKLFNILNHALRIPFKNSNFIIFTFLSSIPFFCFLVSSESFFRTTLAETLQILAQSTRYTTNNQLLISVNMTTIIDISCKLAQLGLLYLFPLYLLQLCTMIVAVNLAAKIYKREEQLSLREEEDHKPDTEGTFKGTIITFIYVIFLSTAVLLGSIWLAINYYLVLRNFFYNLFLALLYRAACIVMLTKYLEMSVVWNIGSLVPILEKTYGAEALMLSVHLNRGSGRTGSHLMFVFFVWEFGIRAACFFIGCNEKWGGIVAQSILLCLGNLMKWVSCTVYFYDSKKRNLEGIDEEEGRGTGSGEFLKIDKKDRLVKV